MTTIGPVQHGFTNLRGLARRRSLSERCEMCGTGLLAGHPHLVEPLERKIVCACDACSLLFTHDGKTKFKRVPRSARMLWDFRLTDAQWDGLLIPIGMAYFLKSSVAGRVLAFYPSPAGATESTLPLGSWEDIVHDNPALSDMESDVEALLVSRLDHARQPETDQYYIAPIDRCYELVGLIRFHWRGLSGGAEVWNEIRQFFDRLQAAVPRA